MADITFKSKKVPGEYNITSRETIRWPTIYACYAIMRERHTRNILNESEVSGLSGSGYGEIVKKKPLLNSISHDISYTVAVCDIFDCTGHM